MARMRGWQRWLIVGVVVVAVLAVAGPYVYIHVIEGKAPKLGILVEIDECYTQCSKALIRSDLWNPEQHIDRSELPSSGEIMRAVREEETFDADEYDRARAERYARREGLY